MRSLTVHKKTGFSTLLPFEIFDRFNNLFYSNEFCKTISKGNRLNFNLPRGNYSYNGSFILEPNAVNYKLPLLPKPQRRINDRKYKILFSENPNKCTINYSLGVINFDNAFKKAPVYIIYDIYFHEIGHHFYKSEHLADLYATKKMLELGFNPSQIGRTPIVTLSKYSDLRKIKKINSLKNTQNG